MVIASFPFAANSGQTSATGVSYPAGKASVAMASTSDEMPLVVE
jgi:hypothetical protein